MKNYHKFAVGKNKLKLQKVREGVSKEERLQYLETMVECLLKSDIEGASAAFSKYLPLKTNPIIMEKEEDEDVEKEDEVEDAEADEEDEPEDDEGDTEDDEKESDDEEDEPEDDDEPTCDDEESCEAENKKALAKDKEDKK